jgi:hypothetical protein
MSRRRKANKYGRSPTKSDRKADKVREPPPKQLQKPLLRAKAAAALQNWTKSKRAADRRRQIGKRKTAAAATH